MFLSLAECLHFCSLGDAEALLSFCVLLWPLTAEELFACFLCPHLKEETSFSLLRQKRFSTASQEPTRNFATAAPHTTELFTQANKANERPLPRERSGSANYEAVKLINAKQSQDGIREPQIVRLSFPYPQPAPAMFIPHLIVITDPIYCLQPEPKQESFS